MDAIADQFRHQLSCDDQPTTSRRLTFRFKVLEEEIDAEAVVFDQCVYIWAGRQRLSETLFFGRNDQTLQISGNPTPNHAVFLQQLCLKLARLFAGKQVYFSTDMGSDNFENHDHAYWTKFFDALKKRIDLNKTFFGLES